MLVVPSKLVHFHLVPESFLLFQNTRCGDPWDGLQSPPAVQTNPEFVVPCTVNIEEKQIHVHGFVSWGMFNSPAAENRHKFQVQSFVSVLDRHPDVLWHAKQIVPILGHRPQAPPSAHRLIPPPRAPILICIQIKRTMNTYNVCV